jgi:hypothetical protein
LALNPVHASHPDKPGLADPGAVQGEDDDHLDDDGQDFRATSTWVSSILADLTAFLRLSHGPAHTSGRTLPIRC